uniref:NADP-dependent oxidoreductase domain-containing protein n=1 Tax=Pyramimonas obovata TaxID=1411642 RepID=A0A7S0RQD5_9CHLO|mmetsp:Transcript_4123/g.8457  ORF Transcript_4123/g.8457 Transcript_4123/m.8457 type:complete len:403 (+) Transcript_4123:99-1307(+)|eukprot:CAMPEP_0118924942 /NCGR_PEP_ID=MMETSP1169-20130426/2871_1 /TAXON_ID=36882 /ORGANISM="Pyramimonas obovata, Strain CCMP722" /LENGTH=402 /DNA_ID=CAMNT_0006866101 /DNA_START=99 /DNA_END=1307 /DNA_ORIENTATION=-
MSVTRGDMKYVKFGNSDMMVSECCAGTMTWGSFNDKEEQAWEQMDALWDAGVNFYDTAELYPVAFNYGKTTEVWMGNWMEKRIAEGKFERSKIYIATKVNPMGIGCPDDSRAGKPHSYDKEVVFASCRGSLERLKTSYIDLYQFHWPSRDTPIFGGVQWKRNGEDRPMPANDKGELDKFEQTVLSAKALIDEGLIKYWGLSNENGFGITMICMMCDKLGCPRPISLQNDFSLVDRVYENDPLEACHRFGIVGLPYGALAGGVLTGKYHKKGELYAQKDAAERPLDECRMRKCPEFQPRYGFPMAMKATEKYMALAEKYGLSPCEMALAWANSRWYNGAIIIGTTTVRQVAECVGAFKITLPDELMKEIDVIHEEVRNPICFYADKPTCAAAPWLADQITCSA